MLEAGSADLRWEMVYSHDHEGEGLQGSKPALIDAVSQNKPVRIYYAGGSVQHISNSCFPTISKGEVIAQASPISGYGAAGENSAIAMLNNVRNTTLATNGDRALKWFVLN